MSLILLIIFTFRVREFFIEPSMSFISSYKLIEPFFKLRKLGTCQEYEFPIGPVQNVARIFSCLFHGSLVQNETKSDANLIMFLANAMEIP